MAATSNHPAPAVPNEPINAKDKLALIERVAASEQFSRSTRLRDFLLYVGKQSLKEGCADIHEQEIGAQVFGRPITYDRSQDNIVRVNATELRRRIETYFATTGAQEPLVFEIPRGSYKPVFRWRQAEAADGPAGSEPASSAPATGAHTPRLTSLRFPVYLLWAVVTLALAISCAVLLQQNRTLNRALHPWGGQPAVTAFWTGFLDPHRETDLVLPDDSASVIEDITGNPVTLDGYLSREYIRRIQTSTLSNDRKQDVYQVFNHNLVTFGAVRAAQLVISAIPVTYPHYLALARNFTADEFKRDNVVLIGGKKSVPWDHLFDDQLNFITDYDDANSMQFVRNLHPRPGEQAIYAVSTAPNNLFGYAVVAYLPSPSRTSKVIILAGTDSDATGAAAAYLTSEGQMEKLRKTLHAQRFPYFEVLLKTSRLSGTFFDSELIAYRTHPELN